MLFAFLPLSGVLIPIALPAGQAEKTLLSNCLIVTVDTLRADSLSSYASRRGLTPQIDALAKKGIVFEKAFAHSTTTLPSHANIFLGVTPPYHGVHDNANFAVAPEFLTLAELLQERGFATAAFVGAYPLDSRFGLNQGFDLYDDDFGVQDFAQVTFVERKAEVVVDRALEWIRGQRGSWFAWVHCFDPHYPYEPPEPFRSQHKERAYEGEVAYVDSCLGRLFDYMEEAKLFDRTLVVFTADHGESLGDHGEKTHGYLAYNSTLWVPLIMAFPAAKPGRIAQEVCHIDIFPTVCDLLKVEKPSFLQGLSLLPLVRKKSLPQRAIYFESLYPYYSRGWAPLRGYLDFSEKFIESPLPELYNLQSDFGELQNLAPGRDLKAQKKKLMSLLEAQSYADRRPRSAAEPLDRASMEKLKSLGYISSAPTSLKKDFGPEDDVKSLLPYENKATEAMDLYKAGHVSEAIRLLQGILEQRKDLDVAYTSLATVYKETGRLEEALSVLKQGLDFLPESYNIFLTDLSYLLAAKEYEQVVKLFGERNLPQAEHDPEIWNSLGVAHARLGNLDKAISAYEKALSIDKDYPAAYNNLGIAYLGLAQLKKDAAALRKAIHNFQQAIQLDARHAAAYNGLGGAYKISGRLEDAISCWKEALKLKPDFEFPLYNLGVAYIENGDLKTALRYFLEYKERFYEALPPEEKKRLDENIRKCMGEK